MMLAHPERLVLLVLLPVLVGVLVRGARGRREALDRLGDPALLARVLRPPSLGRRVARALLQLAATAALVYALAGPRWGFQWEEVRRQGVDVVVALDLSRSMLAQDLPPDRLTAARRELRDLLGILQGDRLGLVVFAGSAFVQVPLTLDYHALELFIDRLDPSLVPIGGSDLAAGLRKAIEAFAPSDRAGRAVIFITDGEDHSGALVKAAEEARDAGVHVFVVGLGDPAGAPIPDGSGGFIEEDGRVVLSKLGEAELKEVAALTDGAYVRGTAGDLDLRSLYDDGIRGKLRAQELSSTRQKRWEERFQWPLAVAVILMVLEALLRPVGRRVAAGVLLVALAIPEPAHAGFLDRFAWGRDPLAEGHAAFVEGRFQDALASWVGAQAEFPDDRRIDYDIGAAHYRLGQFAEAEEAWKRASLAKDGTLAADALYNAGNAAFQQGKFTEAMALYDRSLQLRPADAETQSNRDLAQKKYEEALASSQEEEPPQEEESPSQEEKGDGEAGENQEKQGQGQEPEEGGEGQQGEQKGPQQQQGRGATGQEGKEGEDGGKEDGQGQGEAPETEGAAEEGAGGKSEAEGVNEGVQGGQAAAADLERGATPDGAEPPTPGELASATEAGAKGSEEAGPAREGALSPDQARALLQALEADRQARQRERTRRAGSQGASGSAGRDW